MFIFLFNILIFFLSFFLVLSFLVIFHELGHYGVARLFKVRVERFSIGFGRVLLGRRSASGTEWTLNALPLGGYVKFLGDKGAASNPDQAQLSDIRSDIENQYGNNALEECFHFKPLWQRALIVLAGPVANFILAIVIFAVLVGIWGTQETRSVVVEVMPDGAAAEAGIQAGDRFLRLNGKDVSLTRDLIAQVALNSNEKMLAEVERAGIVERVSITPRRMLRRDSIGGMQAVGTIGIRVGSGNDVVRRTYTLLSALEYGVDEVRQTVVMTGQYIGRIFTAKEDGKAFGGVVRIATMTGKTAVDTAQLDISLVDRIQVAVLRLFSLAAFLSIGLGIANLLPIPALDGGHLLYYGYEALMGRPLSEQKQELGFSIGLAILLSLFMLFTWNDIHYIRSLFS